MKYDDEIDGMNASTGEGRYEVGYGKPPKSGRFPPGQSGNPSGRKKALVMPSSRLEDPHKEMFLREMSRVLTFQEGGKSVSMSATQLIVRRMVTDAIKGNARAGAKLLGLLASIQSHASTAHADTLQAAMEAREMMLAKKRKAKREGRPEPKFSIEPWDIRINSDTGNVVILDPSYRDLSEELGRCLGEEARLEDLVAEKPEDGEAAKALKSMKYRIAWLTVKLDQIAAENAERLKTL